MKIQFLEDSAVPKINDTSFDPVLDAIGNLDQKFELMCRGMAELQQTQLDTHREITSVRDNVTFLSKRVDDRVPRRDFSAVARQQFVYIVWKRYDGSCPCCAR
jgi:hypothetical protein